MTMLMAGDQVTKVAKPNRKPLPPWVNCEHCGMPWIRSCAWEYEPGKYQCTDGNACWERHVRNLTFPTPPRKGHS